MNENMVLLALGGLVVATFWKWVVDVRIAEKLKAAQEETRKIEEIEAEMLALEFMEARTKVPEGAVERFVQQLERWLGQDREQFKVEWSCIWGISAAGAKPEHTARAIAEVLLKLKRRGNAQGGLDGKQGPGEKRG